MNAKKYYLEKIREYAKSLVIRAAVSYKLCYDDAAEIIEYIEERLTGKATVKNIIDGHKEYIRKAGSRAIKAALNDLDAWAQASSLSKSESDILCFAISETGEFVSQIRHVLDGEDREAVEEWYPQNPENGEHPREWERTTADEKNC